MTPSKPLNWQPGQIVFFCQKGKTENITHVVRIKHKQKERVLVDVLNSTHSMVFDPKTLEAKPFGIALQVCWLGDERYQSMNYNDAINLAQIEYKEALWQQRK